MDEYWWIPLLTAVMTALAGAGKAWMRYLEQKDRRRTESSDRRAELRAAVKIQQAGGDPKTVLRPSDKMPKYKENEE